MSNSVEYEIAMNMQLEAKEAKEAKESLGNKGHATKQNLIHGISEDFKIIKSKKIMTTTWNSRYITDVERKQLILLKQQEMLVALMKWEIKYKANPYDSGTDHVAFINGLRSSIKKTISKRNLNKLIKELTIAVKWCDDLTECTAAQLMADYGLIAFLHAHNFIHFHSAELLDITYLFDEHAYRFS